MLVWLMDGSVCPIACYVSVVQWIEMVAIYLQFVLDGVWALYRFVIVQVIIERIFRHAVTAVITHISSAIRLETENAAVYALEPTLQRVIRALPAAQAVCSYACRPYAQRPVSTPILNAGILFFKEIMLWLRYARHARTSTAVHQIILQKPVSIIHSFIILFPLNFLFYEWIPTTLLRILLGLFVKR